MLQNHITIKLAFFIIYFSESDEDANSVCSHMSQLPPGVKEDDLNLYNEAKHNAQVVSSISNFDIATNFIYRNYFYLYAYWFLQTPGVPAVVPATPSSDVPSSQGPFPPCIEFGQFEINTWYSAPYPQEYSL